MSSVPVPEGPPSPYSDDLALAGACLSGDEAAWERLIATYRPILYRAADAIDPSGGSRDLADGLFADLYGLRERDGQRQSLLRYYQGRSRLGTWLRAVLAQRHIDRLRANRRNEPLEKIEQAEQIGQTDLLSAAPADDAEPERARYVSAMQQALKSAIGALDPRDRLRLASYYAQDMTLAAIGRLLKEHEATVSRHLTRTRRELRDAVEARLRKDFAMNNETMAECFRSVSGDAGTIDLADLVDSGPDRKVPLLDRSTG